MKKILVFVCLVVVLSTFFWLGVGTRFPSTHIFIVRAGECNYFLYDTQAYKQYYISGESTVDVTQFVDQEVKVSGRIVDTSSTTDAARKLYYDYEKIKTGECQVNPDIAIAAVKIKSIEEYLTTSPKPQ